MIFATTDTQAEGLSDTVCTLSAHSPVLSVPWTSGQAW